MSNKKYFVRFNKAGGRLEQQITLTGQKPVGFGWKEIDVDECCAILPTPQTYLVTYESTASSGMIALSPYDLVFSDNNAVALFPNETAHILQDNEYYYSIGSDGSAPTTVEVEFKLEGVVVNTISGLSVTGDSFVVPVIEFDEIHFVLA